MSCISQLKLLGDRQAVDTQTALKRNMEEYGELDGVIGNNMEESKERPFP